MKAKLSLIIALAVTSLAVGIPTAVADSAPTAADWFERAAAASARNAATYRKTDAFDRSAGAVSEASAVAYRRTDAFERPDPTSFQTSTTVADSGMEIAWPQIGIAFAVGLLLALGLMMALRLRPNRPLAQ